MKPKSQELLCVRRFFIITLAFVSAATCALAQEVGNPFSILVPGSFQDVDFDDFNFPPKGWLALVVKGGHSKLMPATVRVENDVISSNHSKALALLHDRGLVAGKVDTPNTKFLSEQNSLSNSSRRAVKIAYNGIQYRITMNKSGTIFLEAGGSTTILDRDREDAKLIWAGDLDKDGKLDLILYSGTDKNATYCLYLSGMAGEKALVKAIGCQFYSG